MSTGGKPESLDEMLGVGVIYANFKSNLSEFGNISKEDIAM